jgi:putative nucleotidyltransferase with HDIG domain
MQMSLLLTLACFLTAGFIVNNGFYMGAPFLITGILSSMFVFNIRRRICIIKVSFIIGIANVIALFFLDRFIIRVPERYAIYMLNGIISGVIVIGLLPVFEYLFKTVTNISLLELTDFNHPLLQRLIMEAPGTYHHSLIVGNLSEAACLAVGANGLLARIGSYYHDIGKLNKPEYFSENQQVDESKHDSLTPTISKLVIMNHVKEGRELAEKYKLNTKIIDFIMQHHGTSLVFYFYRRALESFEQEQEVKEGSFRYPGPKPDTKEAAIVLLADSVEAAARALKDPTHAKIQDLVQKIINNKFIDGQLDKCSLTLKDIEKIAAVFTRMLSGIYHNRVTYPEDKAVD